MLLAIVLLYGIYTSYQKHTVLDYHANLDEVAAYVDDDVITLRDMGFYVLLQEHLVEEKAAIYNERSTKDFWNLHINGIFIQAQAKKAAMGMAIHDRIFYREAVKEGIVLTSKEKEQLENARTDFWADLSDEQKERIPGTFESVNRTIKEIGLAEKYQRKLVDEMHTSHAGLGYDGYDYKKIMKNEHDVRINNAIWDRVVFGDITLKHTKVNYINGHNEGDSEK